MAINKIKSNGSIYCRVITDWGQDLDIENNIQHEQRNVVQKEQIHIYNKKKRFGLFECLHDV